MLFWLMRPTTCLNIVTALLLLLAMPACKHDNSLTGPPEEPGTGGNNGGNNGGNTGGNNGGNNGGGGNTGGVPCDPNTVYFQNQVLPILISNCAKAGCHDANSRQDGVELTSYQSVMNTVDDVTSTDPDDNDLLEVLLEDDADKRMPQPPNAPLTAGQINLIRTWINQGAQNQVCDENAGGCDVAGVTFSGFVQPLIQTKCQGCHSGSAPSGGINLASYAGVQAAVQSGKLFNAITRTVNWMPQGGARLDDCTIDKVKAWIDAGAPNN
jgi:hypothetical protein